MLYAIALVVQTARPSPLFVRWCFALTHNSKREELASYLAMVVVVFSPSGENYLTEGYVVTPKTMELLRQHLMETGGKVHEYYLWWAKSDTEKVVSIGCSCFSLTRW